MQQTVTKIMAKVIFGSQATTMKLIIYTGITTPFIPLSTPVYSHCGKMTVVVAKYFCEGQKHRRSYVGIGKLP